MLCDDLEGWTGGRRLRRERVSVHIRLIHFIANRRGKVEAVTDFIFLGSKITVDGNCSHEI